MIVDAHAHAAGRFSTAASLLEAAQSHGLEKIFLCTGPKNNTEIGQPPAFPLPKNPNSNFVLNRMLRFAYNSFLKGNGDGNAFVSELSRAAPDMVVPFLWIDPLDPAHVDSIEANLKRYHARGIKLHQAWNAFTFDGLEFQAVADQARFRSLPIFVHIYSTVQVRKLLRFLLDNPNLILIVGHLAGVSIFAEYRKSLPNLYFDTSGSERIQGKHILEAINLFGSDHVLFGSDTPYAQIEDAIARIDRLNLSDDAKENVYRKNALNILSRTTTTRHACVKTAALT